MNRDQVINKARTIGWHAEACYDKNLIAVRAYEATDPHEKMRFGSNGEIYTNGSDGWMYQVGTVEDIDNAIQVRVEK